MITEKVSVFRRILPQVIATSVESIHHIDMGLSGAMPTILIANLSGIVNESNSNETLTMTGVQASWLAATAFLILPLGSFASGFFADYFGRRRCLQLVNIPFIIGWIILYQTFEIWHIFASAVILTLGASLIKTTMVAYVGEICEPSIRTILVSLLNTSISFGMFIAFILNTVMPWRKIALFGLATPLISCVCVCFIPESPHWLLSKNRTKEAEKSLCWLRGWVSHDKIEHEFKALQRHSEHFKACNSCFKQNLQCSHPPPTLTEKLSELKRRRTMKPFMILFPLFIITQFSGMQSMCPFIIQIFRAYASPISPDKAAIIMSSIDNLSHILFIFVVRITGKRKIFLLMGVGVFVSLLMISCYGFIYLPSGYGSFNQENQTFRPKNQNLAYIPTACLFLLGFCSKFGFLAMPFMLLSELFPFRTRGAAIGVAVAFNFFLGFLSKKTYYNLETTLSMAGVSFFYCIICCVGLILMYFILPETEGLTLEDIEVHFSDNTKKITDWKIAKVEKVQDYSKEQQV